MAVFNLEGVGRGRLVSPAAHPLLGSPLPPFYKHTSMEPLSGFLLSFQMCTKVSSAAERSWKRETQEGWAGSQNAHSGTWGWSYTEYRD